MHSRKTVPIIDLMSAANMELIRWTSNRQPSVGIARSSVASPIIAEKTRLPLMTQKPDHNTSNTVMVWTSVTPPQN